jgi:hypothetical protein
MPRTETIRTYRGPIGLIVASVVALMITLLAISARAAEPEEMGTRDTKAQMADAGLPADADVDNGYGTSPSRSLAGVSVEEDPVGFVTGLYEAGRSKDYRAVAAALLLAAVYVLRRWGAKWLAPLGTDRGGALTVLLVGVLGAFSTALTAGKPLGLSLVYDGLMMGLTAAGGWVVVKRIVSPKDGKTAEGYSTSPSKS